MKYCTKCGKELFVGAGFCHECGCRVQNNQMNTQPPHNGNVMKRSHKTKTLKILIPVMVAVIAAASVICVFASEKMTADEIAAVSIIEGSGKIKKVKSASFLEEFNNGYNDFCCYYVKTEDGSQYIVLIKDDNKAEYEERVMATETTFFEKNKTREDMIGYVNSDFYTSGERLRQYTGGYFY